MKISAHQLDMVLSKMRYSILGYSSTEKDFEVEISISKEDPGNGIMVDCFTLKAVSPDSVETMIVEIYPTSEQIQPRASKTQSFTITSKY